MCRNDGDGRYPADSRWWEQVPVSIGVISTAASQAARSLPGGPGPARAHPWATARPLRSTRVMHQRVRPREASASARSRQVSASRTPYLATSPGLSERPSQASAGMVRLTDPPRPPAQPPRLAGKPGPVPAVPAPAALAPVPALESVAGGDWGTRECRGWWLRRAATTATRSWSRVPGAPWACSQRASASRFWSATIAAAGSMPRAAIAPVPSGSIHTSTRASLRAFSLRRLAGLRVEAPDLLAQLVAQLAGGLLQRGRDQPGGDLRGGQVIIHHGQLIGEHLGLV